MGEGRGSQGPRFSGGARSSRENQEKLRSFQIRDCLIAFDPQGGPAPSEELAGEELVLVDPQEKNAHAPLLSREQHLLVL